MQNDSLIELLDVIAHDIKMPLTAVKGFIELVEAYGPLNEKQQHYVERALAGLGRIEQLATMMVDIVWLDADKPLEINRCDIGTLINNAVMLIETVAVKRSITIRVTLAPDLGIILGDERRLSQVIHNLIGNAVKYNNDGGEVIVSAAGQPDYVEISVRDTGLGIPPEDLPQVFDRFFRSKAHRAKKIEGSGLGLSIAKGVIEKHHGQIRVESTLDVGTTFTFTLPRRPHIGEGEHRADDLPLDSDERESADTSYLDAAGEEPDAVDDDLQESDEKERGDEDEGG